MRAAETFVEAKVGILSMSRVRIVAGIGFEIVHHGIRQLHTCQDLVGHVVISTGIEISNALPKSRSRS